MITAGTGRHGSARPPQRPRPGQNPEVTSPISPFPAAGIDFGATLLKAVVLPDPASQGGMRTFLAPADDVAGLARFLRKGPFAAVGVVGGGARRWAAGDGALFPVVTIDEFAAWGAGEKLLLDAAPFVPTRPHLLVSLGTGTSILSVDGSGKVSRVGGTALGGGTLRGLGRLLLGEDGHEALIELARGGDRRKVDLLVGDLYGPGEISLHGDLTAANFGKLASTERADGANALCGLLGENVALLAGSLARSLAGGETIDVVYGGATLRGHDVLRGILLHVTGLAGARARFLPNGEFAGAVGALSLALGRGRP